MRVETMRMRTGSRSPVLIDRGGTGMAVREFVRRTSLAAVVATLALAANGIADARITSLQVTSTTSAFNGTSFGSVGPYENVVGVAHGELDPEDPLNAVI